MVAFVMSVGLILITYGSQGSYVNYHPFMGHALTWGFAFLGAGVFCTLNENFFAPDLDNYALNRIVIVFTNLLFIIPWVVYMIHLFQDVPLGMLLEIGFLMGLLIPFFIIALPIELVAYIQNKHWEVLKDNAKIKTCPLNQKLPPELKDGVILALRAEDHYVHIITDKGNHMMLSTLSDSIEKTNEIEGVQVHRSYWVARNGVKDISRTQGRYQCTLTNGTTIPISKSGIKEIRSAGWIS